MSKLDELIQEYCPNGVEYKPLEEILKIKNGSDYKNFGEGDIPVYGSGGIMAYVDHFAYDKPSVLIPRKGSIDKLYYVDTPFWNVDTIFYTEINTDKAEPRYVYHCLLKEHLEQYNTAGGVPSLTQKVLNKVKIPVPPLEVQREIVRILDNFTLLTAELTAELTARRKQYEYYRNDLLDFSLETDDQKYNKDIEYKSLEQCCNILDSKRKPVTKSMREFGEYPYYGANGIQDYVSNYIFDGSFVLVGEDGSVITPSGNPVVNWAEGKIWVNNHAHIIEEIDGVLLRYLFHYLQTVNVSDLIHGNIPKLTGKDFRNILIPVPPMEIQEPEEEFVWMSIVTTAGSPRNS